MDFEVLYRRHARDVYRFALFLTGKREEADDITAETFVRAWTAPEPIRVGTVKAYLFMIARNLHRSGLRQRNRHVDLHDDLRDPSRDPEAIAAERHELFRITQAIQTLPEADRAALLMRAQDDMPYEEIAAVLGITVAAAKVKVHRARVKLNETRSPKEIP
jgi:RNA polymerase sigma-70 factor (ECF subfamily)